MRSITELVKAVKFQRDTEYNFAYHPEMLASVVNYCLFVVAIEHDYWKCRPLFERALEMAPQHPIVLYGAVR
jgi:hypothetical protein